MSKRKGRKNNNWLVIVLVVFIAIGSYFQNDIERFLNLHVFNES